MPWASPTLSEIQDRVRSDLQARLPGTQPVLRRSLARIIADIDAGSMHGLYGYLDWLSRQQLPDTADAEILVRHGDIWGIPRLAATFAAGLVVFTGTNGITIPQGTLLQSPDGAQFATDEVGVIAAGSATIAVTAVNAGDASNQIAATELSLVSGIDYVDSVATVDVDGITGGTDIEDIERLRDRILARIKQPPHGGNASDYKSWALAGHPDVTRAWVSPNEMGVGTVTIRVLCDNLPDPVPTQAVLDAVADYIEDLRPITAEVYVVAPVAVPLDLTLSIAPDIQTTRDLIEAAIPNYLAQYAQPGGTLYLSQLNGAIYIAAGDAVHALSSPSSDITYNAGEVAVMGDITWV